MANNPVPMDDASANNSGNTNNSGSNSDPNPSLNGNQSGPGLEAETALGFMAARVRLQRKLAGLGNGAPLEGDPEYGPEQTPDVSDLPQPPRSPYRSAQPASFQPISAQTPPLGQAQKQPTSAPATTNQPHSNRPDVSRPPINPLHRQGHGEAFSSPINPAVPGGISRSRAVAASHRTPAIARPGTPSDPNPNAPSAKDRQNGKHGKRSKLFFWQKAPSRTSNESAANGRAPGEIAVEGAVPWPAGSVPEPGFPAGEVFSVANPPTPKIWERQPYSAIAHTLAIAGTLTGAWFFGILVAQLLPGNVTRPPLQEALLRKSSRLARSLWHFPELWQTPTAQTRIEAIPLPETGPVLAPIPLSPIERQPLIDELNAIETEIITLDRRLQGLEKKLGKPPYQGTDIDNRLNALRGAIDPLPRTTAPRSSYTPTPRNPAEALLDIAELKITLPSDALFTPGQDQLREAALLTSVLDQLVNYREATIVIRSYSDDQVSALDSRRYTLNQANALGDYLQAALPNTHRWVTVGAGLSHPIASNDSEASRQQNRRIEILVDTR